VETKYLDILQMVSLFSPLWVAFQWVWGANDPFWVCTLKRVFLLLPLGATVLGYWTSLLSIPTLVVRADRRLFVNTLIMTWWDFGRGVFYFWGGWFKFLFQVMVATTACARTLIVGTWVLLHDLVLIPWRVVTNLGSNMVNPGVPWIAVALTCFWCAFEAVIFTFVMSPLVIDTLSNMTGNQLSETVIRLPLFFFMLFIALGSYSVLSTWTQALKEKNIPAIVKIGAIEGVALFVEVVFLYREFVDALVPWFAQHTSGKFELGIFGTLLIAGITWFGIRSLSWFLFAASGTPTIMAVIQGRGLTFKNNGSGKSPWEGSFELSLHLVEQFKKESAWAKKQGEELLSSFAVPPLQVVAACTNFFSLLINSRHVFNMPLKSLSSIKDAKSVAEEMTSSYNTKKAA